MKLKDKVVIVTTSTSVFMASREVLNYMRSQGGGSIINISSVGGIVPDISQSPFSILEFIVFHLISHLRCQLPLKGKPK